jgi:hypothetical protein
LHDLFETVEDLGDIVLLVDDHICGETVMAMVMLCLRWVANE